jgi:hypothetical protein
VYICYECHTRLPRLDVSPSLAKATNRKSSQDDSCCNEHSAKD